MGDLDHWEAYRAFVRDIGLYEDLFAVTPQTIVHDLHPDYASTNYARERAASDGLRLIAVQHHHAHMASCMAEYGLNEPVIGVSFDGTGFGIDGAVWGGEFLVGDYRHFRRAAHLRYVGMPGGDRAIREPWRMAVAYLHDADCSSSSLTSRISAGSRRTVETMIERGFNTPQTSSAGRLFDAVAAIVGVRDRVAFEGQAAQQLEWLAAEAGPEEPYSFEYLRIDTPTNNNGTSMPVSRTKARDLNPADPLDVIDTRPVIRAVLDDVNRGIDSRRIARRFHSTVVDIILKTCCAIRKETQLGAVVLSGGVFMNALITRDAAHCLLKAGFRVYQHHVVPPNDGGLSLGQLAIAASTLASTTVAERSSARSSNSSGRSRLQEEQAHVPRHSG